MSDQKDNSTSRRNFLQQTASAGLLAALAPALSLAQGSSDMQRGHSMTRKILMNGKFTTLDPSRP